MTDLFVTGRRFLSRLLICALVMLVLSSQASAAGFPVIVQLSSSAALSPVLLLLNGTLLDSIPEANLYLIRVPQLPVITPLLQMLGVQWLELNTGVAQPDFTPPAVFQVGTNNAPDWYKNQPAFQLIRVKAAQKYSTGQGVVVADINSLVDYSHPALAGHLTSGYDFVSDHPTDSVLNQSSSSFLDQSSSSFLDEDTSNFLNQSSSSFLDDGGHQPAYSHGTMCAAIIVAVNPSGMFMPLRAFDDNGGADLYSLTKAIRYAVTHGANVVNMSWATETNSNAIKGAIQFALNSNVVLTASAGNNNTAAPQYPAAYDGVLSIAATDIFDVKGSFSNYGQSILLDAPGVNIISAYPGGKYSIASGTSFSAPIIAGTAALVRALKTHGITSSITSATVNIDSKNPNYSGQLGYGRIDVLNAVH
jgi:thermitase